MSGKDFTSDILLHSPNSYENFDRKIASNGASLVIFTDLMITSGLRDDFEVKYLGNSSLRSAYCKTEVEDKGVLIQLPHI